MKIEVQGNPSEAEVAAIIAAIEMSWPKPPTGVEARPTQSTAWRYAGRWWQDGRLPSRW
jgi:hypothetical protein